MNCRTLKNYAKIAELSSNERFLRVIKYDSQFYEILKIDKRSLTANGVSPGQTEWNSTS